MLCCCGIDALSGMYGSLSAPCAACPRGKNAKTGTFLEFSPLYQEVMSFLFVKRQKIPPNFSYQS